MFFQVEKCLFEYYINKVSCNATKTEIDINVYTIEFLNICRNQELKPGILFAMNSKPTPLRLENILCRNLSPPLYVTLSKTLGRINFVGIPIAWSVPLSRLSSDLCTKLQRDPWIVAQGRSIITPCRRDPLSGYSLLCQTYARRTSWHKWIIIVTL